MSELAPLLSASFAYVFAGFLVGLKVGLMAAGNGSQTTTLFTFSFGIKPSMAINTEPRFAAFTKLGGTTSLAHHRMIVWRAAGQMALRRCWVAWSRCTSVFLAYAGRNLIAL